LQRSSFALVLVFTAWLAPAQNSGTFTQTGNLTRPRTSHTATLLPDGRVLLAGGSSLNIPTASTELYNPSTGAFTATGDMTTPRYDHAATLLPDGKVLITGGLMRGEGGLLTPQASAELYDPSTGTFIATGNMTVPRNRHIANLLHNGNVLIVGGSRPIPFQAWPPYQSAELYDRSSGTFMATGDMTEPGAETATLLPNGKVLITKCVDYCFDSAKPSHAELYDPSTGTFARTGDLVDVLQGMEPMAILLMK
jgi:Galactose oxidase, central domain